MSRGRIAPHQQRLQPWRTRQLMRPELLRSQRLLTAKVRAEAQQIDGPQLREMASGPDLMLPYVTRQKAHQQFAEDMQEFLEWHLPKAAGNLFQLMQKDPARQTRSSHLAKGLGLLRDASGNVIRLDAQDRPYVLVRNGEIVYVKVFKARISPKGLDLDAQCTAANPDGTREVLLVEELPTIHAPEFGGI